jgi:hypothetical protein
MEQKIKNKVKIGLALGSIIGGVSAFYHFVFLALFSIFFWIIVMTGIPKEQSSTIRKSMFWISLPALIMSWLTWLILVKLIRT